MHHILKQEVTTITTKHPRVAEVDELQGGYIFDLHQVGGFMEDSDVTLRNFGCSIQTPADHCASHRQ